MHAAILTRCALRALGIAADRVASLRRWGARDAMGQKLMEFQRASAIRKSLEAVIESPVPFFWNIRKPQ